MRIIKILLDAKTWTGGGGDCSERGKSSFRSAEDLDEFCAVYDWMVQETKIWMKEKGRRAAWGATERYEGFRQELKTFGQMAAFTLLLGDKPIAVAICIVDSSRGIK
jgi:hypothetical protein